MLSYHQLVIILSLPVFENIASKPNEIGTQSYEVEKGKQLEIQPKLGKNLDSCVVTMPSLHYLYYSKSFEDGIIGGVPIRYFVSFKTQSSFDK